MIKNVIITILILLAILGTIILIGLGSILIIMQ